MQSRTDADEEQEQHDWEHTGVREYAEDIWAKAKLNLELITAMNMDALTVSQFDIPVQKRVARSRCDEAPRDYAEVGFKGHGHTHRGMGLHYLSGACRLGERRQPFVHTHVTLMYLTLIELHKSGGRGTGSRFNLLMDNTAGDNKNAEMVIFLC